MIAIIGAVISAIAGLVGSANATASAQLLSYRTENENSIAFSRAKELTFYDAYKNQILTFGIVAAFGFVFLMVLAYNSNKK